MYSPGLMALGIQIWPRGVFCITSAQNRGNFRNRNLFAGCQPSRALLDRAAAVLKRESKPPFLAGLIDKVIAK
jgi:hypothetical protein